MKRCFIFSAGDFYGLHEKPQTDDLILAADAGYRHCLKAGITPDLLLGDFDSMAQPEHFSHILRVPVEKDDTDTMLAAKYGLQQNCDTFFFYGGTGGERLDHTLANLQTLLFLTRNGAKGYLYDRSFVFTVLENDTLTVQRQVKNGILSCFAIDREAKGVTLQGLQYPLCNGTVSPAFPLCISNHFTNETATVRVEDGCLLVGWEI